MQNNTAITRVVAAILYKNEEVLIVRRGPAMSGAGHWEFPGGKVEPAESEKQALEREIREELTLHIVAGEYIGENHHRYPHKQIHLRFYLTKMPNEQIVLTEHDAMLWVRPRDLHKHELSDADVPIVSVLLARPEFKN